MINANIYYLLWKSDAEKSGVKKKMKIVGKNILLKE